MSCSPLYSRMRNNNAQPILSYIHAVYIPYLFCLMHAIKCSRRNSRPSLDADSRCRFAHRDHVHRCPRSIIRWKLCIRQGCSSRCQRRRVWYQGEIRILCSDAEAELASIDFRVGRLDKRSFHSPAPERADWLTKWWNSCGR